MKHPKDICFRCPLFLERQKIRQRRIGYEMPQEEWKDVTDGGDNGEVVSAEDGGDGGAAGVDTGIAPRYSTDTGTVGGETGGTKKGRLKGKGSKGVRKTPEVPSDTKA